MMLTCLHESQDNQITKKIFYKADGSFYGIEEFKDKKLIKGTYYNEKKTPDNDQITGKYYHAGYITVKKQH